MNRQKNAGGKRVTARSVSGFTYVELLVVVGIICVFLALAFVAIINQRRSMFQVELDTTAKEVYIAAQNYLLSAKEDGLLDKSPDYGTADTDYDSDGKIRYFAYDGSGNSGVNSPVGEGRYSALGLMLPFGSIDETVRLNGSYIIRYNKDTGMILDVLYANPHGMGGIFGDFGKATFNTGNAAQALKLADSDGKKKVDNSEARRDVEVEENGALLNGGVLGYYGGEDIQAGEELEKPHVEVENGDKLVVKVTNPNYGSEKAYANLVVIVEGKTSHAKKAFVLRGSSSSSLAVDKSEDKGKAADSGYYYELVLDDVTTAGHHFFDIFDSTTGFAPGEDIDVQAIAYSTSRLTNTARSLSKTDNSLFAALVPENGGSNDLRAQITSFRHLENLDRSVSGLGEPTAATDEDGRTDGDKQPKTPKTIEIVGADLNTDLSWTAFVAANAKTAVGPDGEDTKTIKIYKYGNTEGYDVNSFMPIKPDYVIDFNGDGHAIMETQIKATTSNANAGLFDELSESETVIRNTNLIDFNVDSATGNAGALAGKISNGITINNVNAYNSSKNITSDKSLIKGMTAGGLIGSMEGGTIKASSAAMFVQATGTSENNAAGGLIGVVMSSAVVTQCYAGGHTNDGVYSTTVGNVTSATTAGGLVGITKSSTIEYSYSTCSAFGAGSGVGGLIGFVEGSTTKNSYATGLVKGTNNTVPVGAFVGATSGTLTFEADYYLGIVNEVNTGASGNGEVNGIAEADKSTSDYQAFLYEKLPDGTTTSRRNALPYDSELTKRYNDKYPFKTTSELKNSDERPVLHHGDWPSYETFVVNTKSS